MLFLQLIFSIVLLWSFAYLIDLLLKQWKGTKFSYKAFLEQNGIKLQFGFLRFYTVRFNTFFQQIDQKCPKFLSLWFTAGRHVGVAVMFLSVILLIINLIGYFRKRATSDQLLVPVVPGVNLPWGQTIHYFVCLLFLAVVHEAGHALAATAEQVRINGFAVFLLFLYPGAYVDLHPDDLRLVFPKIKLLKIYCAGAWHNVVVALMALVLFLCMPLYLWPFYDIGSGAVVTSVMEGSAMDGQLAVGSQITAVNSCPVLSSHDWYTCISKLSRGKQTGYCASVHMLDTIQSVPAEKTWVSEEGMRECCKEVSNTHICFSISNPVSSPGSILNSKLPDTSVQSEQSDFKCLAARPLTLASPCITSHECRGAIKRVCVFPAVRNQTRLLSIQHTKDVDALYLGEPRALVMSVGVSDYRPRASLIWLQLPQVLQTFLVYCVSLSSALALLNMLPVFALDGQWTFIAFVETYFSSYVENPFTRNRLYTLVFLSTTILLILNVLLAFTSLF